MKKILFLVVFFLSFVGLAQTNTWTGVTDSNWGTAGNWSLGTVPNVANDVVIPTGSTVVLNVAGDTKSISVNGNANFTISNALSFTNASAFSSASTITWTSGSLNGGGILSNAGTINVTTANSKFFNGATTLNNAGIVNLMGSGTFYLYDGTFNNMPTGLFEFKTGSGSITYGTSGSHVVNNSGTILLGVAQNNTVEATFTNTGTLTATAGNLIIAGTLGANLNGGTYNISSGANITLNSNVNLSGTLSGVLNGQLISNAALNIVATATLAFTGNSAFNWNSGSLNGGGTITNNSKFTIESPNNKFINGATTLQNNNTISQIGSGTFYLYDGTFNNTSTGTFDFLTGSGEIAYGTSGAHNLNNAGLLRNSDSTNASIDAYLINTGTLQSTAGTFTVGSGLGNALIGGTYNVSSGAAINLTSSTTISGTLTGTLNGPMNWTGTLIVDSAAPATFNFGGTTGMVWTTGNLNGGGILTNDSPLKLDSGSNKFFYGATTLVNNNTISQTGSGNLYLYDGTFNNTASGIFDFLSGSGEIVYGTSGAHNLNNAGLIRNSDSTNASIDAYLVNTGTLQSTVGTLTVGSALGNVFNGGIYNVSNGAAVTLTGSTTISGNLTGLLNGPLNWTTVLLVAPATTATFNFTGISSLKWVSGNLDGGGTLINNSPMELISANNRTIYGTTTQLNNNSTITHSGAGNLYIYDGTINNNITGVYDSKLNSGTIDYGTSGLHTFNNAGTIKKSAAGTFTISCELHNNGTMEAEMGILSINSLATGSLDGGVYNVSTGAVINVATQINISGTLTGLLNDPLNWTAPIIVTSGSPAAFNFTGTSSVNWKSGNLDGGGTLTNMSKLSKTTASNCFIYGASTLENSGMFDIVGPGNFYLYDGTLSNLTTGIIDLQGGSIDYGTSGTHIVANAGLIKHTSGGTYSVSSNITNSGIIDSQSGNLNFASALSLTNTTTGRMMGTNTITLPTAVNYTNNGIYAPGGSPGKLTVNGTFKSSPSSILEVELNSLVAETGYDVLAITGGANFDGTVAVILNFQPAIGDTFTVATTTGTISTCTLAPSTMALRNGLQTTFSVACVNNNTVVLSVTSIVAVPPITQDQAFCAGATVANLQATGQNIQWYANASGGSPLASTTVLVSGTYYATQTISGFESTRAAAIVTITTTPVPTAASPQTFLGSATIADLMATGTNIQWYANATGGSALPSSSVVATGIYYVSQTANGCESTRLAVQVTVNPIANMFPFYVDGDGDGFGAGNLVSVTAVDANTPPAGYSLDGTDCDDSNPAIYQSASLFIDVDGDGYDNGSQTVCYGAAIPSGYSQTTLGTDCDDNNVNVFMGFSFFIDADNDGFGSTTSAIVCAEDANTPPTGYALNSTDCNDNDGTVYQSASLFIDADHDGYDNGMATICYGANIPAGYAQTTLGTDCDDNDTNVFQSVTLYVDADADGYDNGSAVFCSGTEIPVGYSATSNGPDCNDNDNTVWQSAGLFIDADSDGYDSGSATVCYGANVPSGYSETSLGTDCDDTNNTVYQSATLFVDADGDGYDNGSATTCYGATTPIGFSVTSLGTDCDDSNAMVNPGATEIAGNGIDDNCNGIVDEGGNVSTTVTASSCGSTIANINSLVGIVSYPGATAYRVRITDAATMAQQTIIRTVPNFRFPAFANYDYAATYAVDIELQINGVWVGYYGAACSVSTPNILQPGGAAQITASQCGITLPSINTLVATTSLAGVTGYRFRVTNMTDNAAPNQVQIIDRQLQWFSFPMLATFTYGTTYQVEVAVKTNGDYTAFGSPCTVTTPPVPMIGQCGAVVANNNMFVSTASLQYVTQYRFTLTNMSSAEVTVIENALNRFTFGQFPGYVAGANYQIAVSVRTTGVWSLLGSSCVITAPGVASRSADAASNEFAKLPITATVYPNPFSDTFMVNTNMANNGKVQLKVYDMLGKLLQIMDVTADEVQSLQLGRQYPAGIYNVILTKGADVKILRVIKR